MAHNVNLNSSEWCDLIFEGKNKAYGAYEMRQSSSKRHLIALGVVILFTALIAAVPSFINAVTPTKEYLGGYDDERVLGDVELEKPKEEVIVEPTLAPPPPPLINSIQFTPPVITDAAEVTEDNGMKSQDELKESTGVVSIQTVVTSNTVGADVADVLKEQRKIVPPATDSGPVDFVEVMPQYPGGNSELMKFLSSNLRYPIVAVENDIQGRVILKFVVGKDGSISDVRVLKSLDPACDKEAMRVVRSMTKWIPGRQNGNAVAVYFNLPVHFKIQK